MFKKKYEILTEYNRPALERRLRGVHAQLRAAARGREFLPETLEALIEAQVELEELVERARMQEEHGKSRFTFCWQLVEVEPQKGPSKPPFKKP